MFLDLTSKHENINDRIEPTTCNLGFWKLRIRQNGNFRGGNDDKSWDLGVPDETGS